MYLLHPVCHVPHSHCYPCPLFHFSCSSPSTAFLTPHLLFFFFVPKPSTLFLISPSPPSCLTWSPKPFLMSFSHLLDPVSHILCHPLKPTSPTPFLMLSSHSSFLIPPSFFHSFLPVSLIIPALHSIPHVPHFVLSWPCYLSPTLYFCPHSSPLSFFLISLHASSSPPITLQCHSLQFTYASHHPSPLHL